MEEILLLNKYFPIGDRCLSCEDIARQMVLWRADSEFLRSFLRAVFPASRVEHISDLHSKFALDHTMCESMVDIQPATAEIRRGKKKKEEEKEKERNHSCKI